MLQKLTLLSSLIAFVLVDLSQADDETKFYDGYIVVRAIPKKTQEVDALKSLTADRDGTLDFWVPPSRVNASVDILVAPEKQEFIFEKLKLLRIPNKIVIYDVGSAIRKSSPIHSARSGLTYRQAPSNSSTEKLLEQVNLDRFYTNYQRYSTIESKLKSLASDKVLVETRGKSFEGRPLYLVKISTDHSKNKPIIFIDGGHHAREWISHSTAMYLLESLSGAKLPTGKAAESEERGALGESILELLEQFDFWFVPVVNPDGYEHTQTRDRLWRKTRSRLNSVFNICLGVDPNRNYPDHWRQGGSGSYSCQEIYAGPKPLSEPETRMIADIITSHKDRIVMYLSLHSYSQVILSPPGWERAYPKNYKQLETVQKAAVKAIESVNGRQYTYGPSAIVMYPASGAADDFAYSQGIKYAFTIELPDKGDNGFLMPAKEIIPVGHETLVGVLAMLDAMKRI